MKAAKTIREEARRERFLNAKVRTIGVRRRRRAVLCRAGLVWAVACGAAPLRVVPYGGTMGAIPACPARSSVRAC